MVGLVRTSPVTHQAASHRNIAPFIDCCDCMTRCQRHNLIAPTVKEGVGADDECTIPMLDQGCKGVVDFAFGTGAQNIDLQIESSGCRL
jgi:hypothetical protein